MKLGRSFYAQPESSKDSTLGSSLLTRLARESRRLAMSPAETREGFGGSSVPRQAIDPGWDGPTVQKGKPLSYGGDGCSITRMASASSSGVPEDGWSGSPPVRCCQRPSTSSQVSGARGTGSPLMVTLRAVASAAQQLMAKRVRR
jgi:hypothetical protein